MGSGSIHSDVKVPTCYHSTTLETCCTVLPFCINIPKFNQCHDVVLCKMIKWLLMVIFFGNNKKIYLSGW